MVSMELIMKIPQDLIVRSLVYLEMIQMITWQSVGQNGYIKMESMFFVCLQERKITVKNLIIEILIRETINTILTPEDYEQIAEETRKAAKRNKNR